MSGQDLERGWGSDSLIGTMATVDRELDALGRESDRDDIGHHGRTLVGHGVDVADGSLVRPRADVHLPGRLPLHLLRYHRSSLGHGRWFGRTWWSTFDLRLVHGVDRLVFVAEDGRLLTYPRPAEGTYTFPHRGPRWAMTCTSAGSYQVRDPQREIIWHFAPKPILEGRDVELGNIALSAITDRCGHRILFVYDSAGAPREVRHSGGYRVRVESSADRITGLAVLDGVASNPQSWVRARTFDYAAGRLVGEVDRTGGRTTYEYDEHGRLTWWADPAGSSVVTDYDNQGRVRSQTCSGGIGDISIDYVDTESGTLVAVRNAFGGRTVYGVDQRASVRTRVDALGRHVVLDRDLLRQPVRHVDHEGNQTSMTYTADGDIARVVAPDGATTLVEYHEPGKRRRMITPCGGEEFITYDMHGNRLSVVSESGERTDYRYGPRGDLIGVTDTHGRRTAVRCDAAGMVVETVDSMGRRAGRVLDGFGRPVEVVDVEGAVTRLTWSEQGLVSRTLHDGATETWTYDGEANVVAHTDVMGRVRSYVYGAFGQCTEFSDHDGRVTRYGYNGLGLVSTIETRGGVRRFGYDVAGQLVMETDESGRCRQYAHNTLGSVAAIHTPLEEQVSFGYDVCGRVVRVVGPEVDATYSYDLAGRLIRSTTMGSTVEKEYDEHGRLVAETVDRVCTRYDYNDAGMRTRRRSGSGAAVECKHLLGRLVLTTVAGRSVEFAYDDAGRERSRSVGEVETTNEWDRAGRLRSATVVAFPAERLSIDEIRGERPAELLLRQRTFGYHRDGSLASIVTRGADSAETIERFEIAELLLGAAADASCARPADETASAAQEYDADEYDAGGRLVRRRSENGVWEFTWDAFDRLRHVRTPDRGTYSYRYDGLGRRIAKLRDGAVTEIFLWDGDLLAEAIRPEGAESHRWEYRDTVPIVQVTGTVSMSADPRWTSEVVRLILTGPDGSITETIDPDTGVFIAHPEDGTGRRGGSAFPVDGLGYWDEETGLVCVRGRYHDPVRGVFVGPAPLVGPPEAVPPKPGPRPPELPGFEFGMPRPSYPVPVIDGAGLRVKR